MTAVRMAADVIDRMQKRLNECGALSESDVRELLSQSESQIVPTPSNVIEVYSRKGVIEPFTAGQLGYIETMLANDLTFCIGPAGTGKTYLAVAVAVSMLRKKQIRKIFCSPGGRGGRTARLFARRLAGQGQSLFEAAV